MKFFDRKKEIKEILSILELEPNRINFIYGPINSGKTTLMKHIIENKIDRRKEDILSQIYMLYFQAFPTRNEHERLFWIYKKLYLKILISLSIPA